MEKKITELQKGETRYEYLINDLRDQSCRFYILKMHFCSSHFSKIFFNNLIKKGYNKRQSLFAYLDDFHPNGRGQEALDRSGKGFGYEILKEILKDCIEKEVKLIFAYASTDSAKKFFIEKNRWIQAYPKNKSLCYKEI